jgi:hypothetical protein
LAPSFFTRSFLSGKSHVIIFRDIFEVVADATVHFFFFGRGKLVLLRGSRGVQVEAIVVTNSSLAWGGVSINILTIFTINTIISEINVTPPSLVDWDTRSSS